MQYELLYCYTLGGWGDEEDCHFSPTEEFVAENDEDAKDKASKIWESLKTEYQYKGLKFIYLREKPVEPRMIQWTPQ